MRTLSIDTYQQIIWVVLEAFERERVPFNFIPSLVYSTEEEQKKAFRGDHYDSARIILSWYHNQFRENGIISRKSLWGFAKKLQTYLANAIEIRWKAIEWEGDFDKSKQRKFIYPANPFSTIEQFPGITKEMMLAEQKLREKRRLIPERGTHTGIFMNGIDRDSDDIYKKYTALAR